MGSNLGDRWALLADAARALQPVAVSQVYETDPVGCPDDAQPFLNAVAEVHTSLSPHALLDRCLDVERHAGRERRIRWGSRTLDLDVLLFDDLRIATDELTIPHPRMFERPFVLTPLADLGGHLIPAQVRHLVGGAGVTPVGPLRW